VKLRLGLAAALVLAFGAGTASATTSDLRVHTFSAPDPEEVAVDGNTAVVGDHRYGDESGAVDFYTLSHGLWTLTQHVTPSDPVQYGAMGAEVAISGTTAAVSEGGFESPYSGRAQVDIFTLVDGTWVQTQTLNESPDSEFGASIAIHGDLMVVGAPTGDGHDHGVAEVYGLVGGTWTLVQELRPSDPTRDLFGASVATNGTNIVVGAWFKKNQTGMAYAFRKVGGVWVQQQRFTAAGAQPNYEVGRLVAVSGPTLAVSAPCHGAVYVYRLSTSMTNWRPVATLASPAACVGLRDGAEVATDGPSIVVAAPAGGASAAGYLYTRTGGSWSQAVELDSPTAGGTGWAVAVEPRLILMTQISRDSEVIAYAGRIIR
jgi:hypothetical protein